MRQPVALTAFWVGSVLAGAQLVAAGEPSCTPPERLVTWPSPRDPAWSLCLVTPRDSSGPSGSGLEVRDARFNGRPVLRRAHAPVVNVFHDDGCGCRRGGLREEAPFEVVAESGPVSGAAGSYAEAALPPRTACEAGSDDAGSFRGVAAERLADRLVLTTQTGAGWQRDTMSWTFRLDGTIEPRFAFAGAPEGCSSHGHVHHVYWRLDFDLEGAEGASSAREEMRHVWEWRKPVTVLEPSGRGYQLVPGPEALTEPPDPSGAGDIWLLRPKPGEISDAGSGCAIDFTGLLDGEPLPGPRQVIWYRGSARHRAGGREDCDVVGPTLQPIGDWSRPSRR